MSKYLIINADDFGYCAEQNGAIKELLEKKLITSTSVMSVCPHAAECGTLNGCGASVGVHLTLNSDSDTARWQSLSGADCLGGTAGMPASQKNLTFHARHRDVYKELCLQYEYLTARGVVPDHADNHCGSLYGVNLRRFYIDAFEFCAEYALPFRFPKTPGFIERQIKMSVPKILIAIQRAIVKEGDKRGVRLLDDLVSNPQNIDEIGCYDNLRKYYLDAVGNLNDGITEMFLHPALPISDEITGWTKRVYEYELLKSGDILEYAKKCGVEVVSWSVFDR